MYPYVPHVVCTDQKSRHDAGEKEQKKISVRRRQKAERRRPVHPVFITPSSSTSLALQIFTFDFLAWKPSPFAFLLIRLVGYQVKSDLSGQIEGVCAR